MISNLPTTVDVLPETALKLKPIIAEKAKERQADGGKNKVVQNSVQPKTRDIIAEKANGRN